MATLTENVLLLSGGRKLKIQNGAISINCQLEIAHGYGTSLLRYDPDSGRDVDVDPVFNAHSLSDTEAVELCECVIALWSKLKGNILSHGITSPKVFAK